MFAYSSSFSSFILLDFGPDVCFKCNLCVCFVSFLGQISGLTSAVCGFARIAQPGKCLALTSFKMTLANLR